MGTLAIGGGYGASIPDVAQAFPAGPSTLLAGTYYALDPLGDRPSEGPIEYEHLLCKFPGLLTGVGRKRMNWGRRTIVCDLVFAGANETGVNTQINSFYAVIEALARFTITLPGGTARQGCVFVDSGWSPKGWLNLGDGQALICSFLFNQLSSTN